MKTEVNLCVQVTQQKQEKQEKQEIPQSSSSQRLQPQVTKVVCPYVFEYMQLSFKGRVSTLECEGK